MKEIWRLLRLYLYFYQLNYPFIYDRLLKVCFSNVYAVDKWQIDEKEKRIEDKIPLQISLWIYKKK